MQSIVNEKNPKHTICERLQLLPTPTHTLQSALLMLFKGKKNAYEFEGQVFCGINEECIFLELTAELSEFFYMHLHFQQRYLTKTLHAASCCLCSTESNVFIRKKTDKKKLLYFFVLLYCCKHNLIYVNMGVKYQNTTHP